METGAHVQKKIKRCLKCGKLIEESWLCVKCRTKNKSLQEIHFYSVKYPDQRYWAYQD